jgi:tetratricopeptide (TPR) repeat protein
MPEMNRFMPTYVAFHFKRSWTLSGLCVSLSIMASARSYAGPDAASSCDPDRAIVDRAMQLRNAGKIAAAEDLLKPILAKNRNSIGANYVLATIELSPGGQRGGNGLSRLLRTEKLVEQASPQCARMLGWYSLYNTIGAQYYRNGDLDRSEIYLLKGYQHIGDMFDSTKKLLLDNLGLLYFSKGNLQKSVMFYEQAQRAGSKDAAKRITAIRRIENSK